MPNRTQLRLNQITGSAVEIKPTALTRGSTAALLVAGDISGSLSYLAQAISNIHGGVEFGNSPIGQISIPDGTNVDVVLQNMDTGQKILIDAKGTGAAGVDILSGKSMEIKVPDADGVIVMGNVTKDTYFKLVSHATPANELVSVVNLAGTAVSDTAAAVQVTSAAGAVTLNAGVADAAAVRIFSSNAAGGVDIDAGTGGLTLDSTGIVSIDAADDLNLTVTSGQDGEDLTIAQIGGNDSSIIITAAGTGTDAIDINATAGDMLIGKALLDGKTLKLGKNAAVEMVLAPHGTPTSEVFSVTNTGGTNDNCIELDAVAGGIKLEAAKSILFESEQGEDDAIQISATNASGGIQLKVNTNVLMEVDAGQVDFTSTAATVNVAGQLNADATTVSTSKTTGALVVDGGAGIALDLFVGDDIFLKSDGAAIFLGDGNDVQIAHNGLTGLNVSSAGPAVVSGTFIGLSGAISFSTDGAMTSDPAGNMAFGAYSDFLTFRSQGIFSAGTTVVGALNALATAAGGGFVGKQLITSSVDSPDIFSLQTLQNTPGFTTEIDLSEASPANTELYINGQLLMSGSVLGANADYLVFGHQKPGLLKFAFDLVQHDVLVIKTTSEQG